MILNKYLGFVWMMINFIIFFLDIFYGGCRGIFVVESFVIGGVVFVIFVLVIVLFDRV